MVFADGLETFFANKGGKNNSNRYYIAYTFCQNNVKFPMILQIHREKGK